MKILVVLILAISFVRIQGVPVLEEDFFEDGSCSPTPPPQPSPPSSCGVRPTSGARIVGGKETQKNSIPWQAMLRTDYAQFCGGSLIHPQWVLTAAHCVVGETTKSFKIWLGAHRREVKEDTTQEFNVIQIVKHENYSSRTMENDMALIKLDRPAILGPGVGLVCLGDDKYHLPLDDLTNQCLISGWGTLRYGGSQPDKLQEVTVPLVSPSECKKAYGSMHSSMLCAGFKEGGMDSCQGDSGGPLVCQYSGKHFLEGATSFGNGCAAPNSYGVYSKVRYLRKFIDDTIQA
ncbi:CUB and peptidase domain-containing protein 1-like [Montipora capricornis]|uniref:CUB and peptidase domain-containing protein 1-like n=1 Tax=Montipora capricornis TaxID=246305 RepID=UPI0035F20CB5